MDIDSIAGPTEVLILADGSARLDWIAADMLAQAEHDPDASSGVVLIGETSAANERGAKLAAEVERQVSGLSRKDIAGESIRRNGYIICAPTQKDAVEIANLKAPEHIEVMTKNARRLAAQINHAGAIFIGGHTPEPVGDYIAGPNHTLPTGGTARFFSPLSVWTFYKTCHTIEATPAGLARHARAIQTLAHSEGLTGHAESIRIRGK
ncbi:histidinol dehydrogenase [Candidatus Sumerlaeota bacterium]|nr:histidinol dehydrogenase [Candidatus Sumerlaeota bacterium]